MARTTGPGDVVFLVDGSSFLYRAYFQSLRQDPRYNVRHDGLPNGAVRTFATKLLQLATEGAAGMVPTHLGVVFDKDRSGFRRDIHPGYKADRGEPPADLLPQLPLMRSAVRAFGLTPAEQAGFEADDLIATYAEQAHAAGASVLMLTADKDMMQLVRPGVWMYDPASGDKGRAGSRPERLIGVDEATEHFGVPPELIVDVQALAGDPVDKVPGARGIGLKTAARLILAHGGLEALLAAAPGIGRPKQREALTDPESVATIRLSRRLVDLDRHVPVEVPLEAFRTRPSDPVELIGFLRAMGFATLARRVGEMTGLDPAGIAKDPTHDGAAGWRDRDGKPIAPLARGATTRAPDVALGVAATSEGIARAAREAGRCGVAFAADEGATGEPSLVALSLSVPGAGTAHARVSGRGDRALPEGWAALLADGGTAKACVDAKGLLRALEGVGASARGLRDPGDAARALEGGRGGHDLSSLARRHLADELAGAVVEGHALTGSGRRATSLADVEPGALAGWLEARAVATAALDAATIPRLAADGAVDEAVRTLCDPMVAVLAGMERRGVSVDLAALAAVAGEVDFAMAATLDELEGIAGRALAPGSTRQVAAILSGMLGADASVAAQFHGTTPEALATLAGSAARVGGAAASFAAGVLEWRAASATRTELVEPLLARARLAATAEGSRVRPTWGLATDGSDLPESRGPDVAVPAAAPWGRAIRATLVAAPGHVLVWADFVDLRLRMLAHLAGVDELREAFATGWDPHAAVAALLEGVEVGGETPEGRARAAATGEAIARHEPRGALAARLGIGGEAAGALMDAYRARFPRIAAYEAAALEACRRDGAVATPFGRRCRLPGIGASDPTVRGAAERAAERVPVEWGAADAIRAAMVAVGPALEAAGSGARLLLRADDGLLLEVPRGGEVAAGATARVAMEAVGRGPGVALAVEVRWRGGATR